MSSPFPLLVITAAYLWIVLVGGPRFMRDRKPFQLTNITRLYNILQVVLCIYFVVHAHQLGYSLKHTWKCVVGMRLDDEQAAFVAGWHFLLLRLSEYVETLFFVLRKKQGQVTSLHVYHHIAVVGLYWSFLKYSAGKFSSFSSMIKLNIIHRRSHGDCDCDHQLKRSRIHVQLLLSQLFQKSRSIYEQGETASDGNSDHSAGGDSRSCWARCHAELQWIKIVLCSVRKHQFTDFHVFAFLCGVLCAKR